MLYLEDLLSRYSRQSLGTLSQTAMERIEQRCMLSEEEELSQRQVVDRSPEEYVLPAICRVCSHPPLKLAA